MASVQKTCCVCRAPARFRAPFMRNDVQKWFWLCGEVCFMIHTNSEWDVLLPSEVCEGVLEEYHHRLKTKDTTEKR